MSNVRHTLVEIAGCQTAFCDPTTTGAPVQFGQAVRLGIMAPVPPSQSMAVDPFDGSWRSSGMTVRLTEEAGILLNRRTSPTTRLTTTLTRTATSAIVPANSNTLFPASGHIWIGDEAMAYTNKTPTSFNGLTRGALGTKPVEHPVNLGPTNEVFNTVYGFNPAILSREVFLWRFDPDNPVVTRVRRFSGFVDDFYFDGSGWHLVCINANQRLQDAQIMSGKFARGTLLKNLDGGVKDNFVDVRLADAQTPFPDPSPQVGVRVPRYFQVGNEIIQYLEITNPAATALAANPGLMFGAYTATGPSNDGTGYYFEPDYQTTNPNTFEIGDEITFANAGTGATVNARVTLRAGNRIYHNRPGFNPAGGAPVTTEGREFLIVLLRPQADTTQTAHKAGDEAKEVRIVSGNHVDVVLQLLTSINGDNQNGAWDVLPPGWGAGLPISLFDTTALLGLKDYASDRRYIFDRTEGAVGLLRNLARITASRIFWNEQGQLTARYERDIYPDSGGVALPITTQHLAKGAIPRYGGAKKDIRNSMMLRGNALTGENDFRDEATFEVEQSRRRFGVREMPAYEDRGLVLSRSIGSLEAVCTAILLRWAENNPWLDITVELNENIWYQPGQLINVTLPHLPPMDGTTNGLTGQLFEVMSFTPNDATATAQMRLARMQSIAETRLVAPCGEVEAVNGTQITLKSSSVTRFAPTNPPNLAALGGGTGQEDVHWFHVNDPIAIFDWSSFGTALPNVHRTIASAIDYNTRVITLATPAPFTIAADDLVRLDRYSTVKAGPTAGLRTPIFMALASSTNNPRTLGADAPHVWGL